MSKFIGPKSKSEDRVVRIALSRLHWQDVIDSLEAPDGLDQVVDECMRISKDVQAQLDEYCDSPSQRHIMIQPEDTLMIAWGEYGICTECFVVRKMPVT